MTEIHDDWLARFIPERYALDVEAKTFALCFRPVMFFEEYTEEQLRALINHSVWEVTFSERAVTADGKRFADYGLMGKGDAFRVRAAFASSPRSRAAGSRPVPPCLCPPRRTPND